MDRYAHHRGIGVQQSRTVRCPSQFLCFRITGNIADPAPDGKRQAYFRGRKLNGREVKVTEGFKGVIVREIDSSKSVEAHLDKESNLQDGGADEEAEEIRTLEHVGSFDDIVLWGHDTTVEGEDVFVKGLGEWMSFSSAVSGTQQASLSVCRADDNARCMILMGSGHRRPSE